jgi:hypothetical protein
MKIYLSTKLQHFIFFLKIKIAIFSLSLPTFSEKAKQITAFYKLKSLPFLPLF